MKRIQPSDNVNHWPRHAVSSIETRKRDLVVRIADWTRMKEEPTYDVEVYVGGVYDWHLSATIRVSDHTNKEAAKQAAVRIAQLRIAELL